MTAIPRFKRSNNKVASNRVACYSTGRRLIMKRPESTTALLPYLTLNRSDAGRGRRYPDGPMFDTLLLGSNPHIHIRIHTFLHLPSSLPSSPPKIYIFVNLHSSLASAQKELEQRTKSISRFTHILTHHKTKIVNTRRGAPREGLASSDQSQACKRSKVSPNRVIGHGFEI